MLARPPRSGQPEESTTGGDTSRPRCPVSNYEIICTHLVLRIEQAALIEAALELRRQADREIDPPSTISLLKLTLVSRTVLSAMPGAMRDSRSTSARRKTTSLISVMPTFIVRVTRSGLNPLPDLSAACSLQAPEKWLRRAHRAGRGQLPAWLTHEQRGTKQLTQFGEGVADAGLSCSSAPPRSILT